MSTAVLVCSTRRSGA